MQMAFQPPPKYLPEDILITVLYRLPVKSLIRCMCVCRTWSHIISSTSFVKAHLAYQNSPSNPNKYILYELGFWWKLLTDSKSLFDGTLNDSTLYTSTEEMLKRYGTVYSGGPKTYGICDGLLCLSNYDYCIRDIIYLWNPTCRKIKKLPELDDSIKDEVGYTCQAFVSFGYHDDDYKVIVIAPIATAYIVCVYTFSTDTWNFITTTSWNVIKTTAVIDDDYWSVQDSKFAGGTVYVIERTYVIRCFDLSNETIREIAFPKEFLDCRYSFKTETYRDTIAIFGFGYHSRSVTMWILRDKSSSLISIWEKRLDNERGGWDYNLEGFIDNGRYLVRRINYMNPMDQQNPTKFFLCDLNFPKLTELKTVPGLRFRYGASTHSNFVDSLLLLNQDNLDPILASVEIGSS